MLFLFLLAAVTGVVILTAKPRFYVSATAIGDDSDYRKILGPAEPAPEKIGNLLKTLKIIRANDRVRIEYPNSVYPSSRLLNYTVHRVGGAEGATTAEGDFRLIHQGIGYGEFPPNDLQRYSTDVPARYFDPGEGTELSTNEVARLMESHDPSLSFRGTFPSVKFLFEYPKDEKLKVIGYHLFDARTKTRLTGGYSWGGNDGKAHVQMNVKKWHAGPVELVVDLATGPTEVIEIPPKEGEVIRQPDWELQLAAVVEGDDSGTSSGSSGTNSYVELRFKKNEDKRRPEISFLFLGDPWAYHLPVDLEIIDKDGKKTDDGGGGSSGRYVRKGTRGKLEDIGFIRATIYKKVRRVVFELPTIYGLPNENDNLQNLFDLRIPYVRVKTQWEFREAIEGMTQLKFAARSPTFKPPPGYFPMEFHDVTPLDLLDEYLAQSPTPQAVAVDEEKRKLILDEPLVQKLIKKIGKVLGK